MYSTTTFHPASSLSSVRRSINVLLLLILGVLILGGGTVRPESSSSSSTVVVMALASSSTATKTTSLECAVVGVGVLGTSLCKQLLESPELKEWKGRYYTGEMCIAFV
jgi:hypothetical protein